MLEMAAADDVKHTQVFNEKIKELKTVMDRRLVEQSMKEKEDNTLSRDTSFSSFYKLE